MTQEDKEPIDYILYAAACGIKNASTMTQEDKKLLYKDLAARQPYRPFVCFAGKVTMPFLDVIASTEGNELMSINGLSFEDVKPYLRPMSSMTEEEEDEYDSMFSNARRIYCNCEYYDTVQEDDIPDFIDWLNAHHFDYRGLIEKGLALEAPEGMYKTE